MGNPLEWEGMGETLEWDPRMGGRPLEWDREPPRMGGEPP